MNIQTLRKKSRNGSLEVEDLLRAAVEKLPGLEAELKALALANGWASTAALSGDATRTVPFAKWAEVAACYASQGFTGLRELAEDNQNIPFVLGLVEEVKTVESTAFVLELCERALGPTLSKDVAFDVVSSVNALFSFKHAAPVSDEQAERFQRFLLALYPQAKSEVHRAKVLLALRGVGDQDAVQCIQSASEFAEPWADTKKAAQSAVQKRIKAAMLKTPSCA